MLGVARLATFMDSTRRSFTMTTDRCSRFFWTASVQDWDRLFAINTRGTFLCYQAAAAQLIKQGRGGRIIGEPG